MKRKSAGIALIALIAIALSGTEYSLVKDGKANAALIRLRPTDAVELFAGMELREYIERITGACIGRTRQASSDRINIYIATADRKGLKLPEKAKALAKKIRGDGFLLYTDPSGLYIIADRKRGLCYGVYELLKRYGKVRWITPGKEGEFVPKSKSFIVPDVAEVVNPSFKHRQFNLVSSYGFKLTPLWQLRNGMVTRDPMFGGEKSLGGHIFSTLLPDSLFPKHPELFGLYGGKRMPQCGKILSDPSQYKFGGQANQPCTSNPETVRIMQENLVKMLEANPDAVSFCILNNDSTKWCECENCRKLDPPEEKKRGMVSTRFWLLANALIEAGKKAAPNVRFFSSPYQTFQEYPAGVRPDPRAEINFCLHHRCYLHSIGDKKCYVNERYRKILESWHKEKRNVQTYEYTDILPRGDVWYLPLARLLHQDLLYYHSIGNDGWCDEVAPYDGTYTDKSRQTTERWIGNALDIYLTAHFLWNVKADYDAIENDAGSLYYGKAWTAMKKYRHLLAAAYEGINDHFCYGSRLWQLGRAFELRGLREQLEEYLTEAETAAKGDPRVEKIVARDREFFNLTFVKAAELFRNSYREHEIRAGEYDPADSKWNFSDPVYAGEMQILFQYGNNKLYLRHDGAGTGAKMEVLTVNSKKVFPVEKPGVLEIPLERAVKGESCDIGLVLDKNGVRSGWNGNALESPGVFRKVLFGNMPFLRDGSFEIVAEKDGKKILRNFASKGQLRIVSDDTAASGKNFLRGTGFIHQYLNGLQGQIQTYGIPEIYREKLRIRLQCRGKGKIGMRLATSKLAKIGEQTITVDSPGQWQDMEFVFDCAENTEPLLLLYVFSHSAELDMDDLRIEKMERDNK